MKTGTKGGARERNLWAREWASSSDVGRGPHEGAQKLFLEASFVRERTGREERRRSWWCEVDRQLGKPGPTGRPWERMERRSGGNVNPAAVSTAENSASVRPEVTWTSEDLRAAITELE